MTAQEFLKGKCILSMETKKRYNEVILWMEEYANQCSKEYAKEELQDLLDAGCYPEYLPEKIRDAIFNIDNPYLT